MRFIEEPGLTANIQATYANFVELACNRAHEKPDRTAYVFLQNGENESGRLTFAELDRRARTIAARLQGMGMAGERALLLYPPGLDYIEGFFGCLYAGVVAVPASPPARRQKSRLWAVINDAAPAIIMTTTDLAAKYRNEFESMAERNKNGLNLSSGEGEGSDETKWGPVWFTTDNPETGFAENWVKPALSPDSLAFLQYTSGSTGNPKGVMVSHGNLMANQASIKQGFGHSEQTTVVGWLPLYHDMGLIGNLLQPLYLGTTAILMPPLAFLEKPVRWLKAISNYRANTSGGPNFAYDLCLRKVTAEQMQDLDLRAWTLAFNGSEPVRAATMERFAEKFADCGFRRTSFFPCYGLAEATLFVTGEKLSNAGCAMPTEANQAVRPVSCGSAPDYHEIRIVDPETGSLCREGHIGEIRVAGPGIAKGYWNRPEESEYTFRARLIDTAADADHPGTGARSHTGENNAQLFLRTGDLGFLDNGRLYLTGRIKDLIIIRGRNFYPQDIEHALTEEIPALIADACVAFSITYEDEEQLVVVAEITRAAMRSGSFEAIAAAMRKVLAEVSELAAAELVLVQPGTVPKTSSGKIRRQPCKQLYLENSLPALFRSGDQTNAEYSGEREQIGFINSKAMEESGATSSPQYQILQQALLAVPQAQRAPLIGRFLKHKIARLLKVEESVVSTDSPLRALGLDSLKAVELKHAADDLLGMDAPLSLFLSDDSLEKIAEKLSETTESIDGCAVHTDPSTGIGQGAHHPLYNSELSSTQFAMWTVQQLEPNNIVYNLHLALRIAGAIDQEWLKQAFRYLTDRHALLRTLYRAGDNDEIIQQVLPTSELPDFFTTVDASSWPESRLQDDMAQRAREPFDLATGPLLRITCYQHGKFGLQNDPLSFVGGNGQSSSAKEAHTLLICAHHIAVDLWSVLILVSELKTIYAGLSAGLEPLLNNLNSSYTDFVAWQRHYLESPACDKAWNYWHRQLAGELPLLALPTDSPRPTVSDYHGASVAFKLNCDETLQLKKLAGQQGVTLFALLLTAYKVLLHRYTHQKDLIVGVPTSGRSQARFTPVVGNFVNPLPLRSYPSGDKAFSAYLAEVNETLLTALEYQDFPFSLMVERLKLERVADHWPIYQTLFVLQQAQADIEKELAQLALGENGEFSDWENMAARPLAIQQRVENFDLKLMAAESKEGLLFSFQYRSELFEPVAIVSMSNHFLALLRGIVTHSDDSLSDLVLLTEGECDLVLDKWNETAADYPKDRCLHELFEARAAKVPEAVAAVCGEERISYGKLNAHANRLANYLRAQGVGPEVRVGLCMERSTLAIVGMLAILKAGGAYVPLDPGSPAERIAEILSDCDAALLLTQERLLASMPAGETEILCLDRDWSRIAEQAADSPPNSVRPANAAYLIYTSGSTGKAKGVVVSHGNTVASTIARFHFYKEAIDGFLLLSPFAFDSSVAGIFWTLTQGGKLCIPPEGAHQDPRALAGLVSAEQISHLLGLPSVYGLLLDAADQGQLESLAAVIVAGEACPPALVARHFQRLPETRLYNEYGPTEGTVWSSGYEIHAADAGEGCNVSIGQPIANTRIYLLDAYFNPVPIGVPGELYIGGEGIARNYHGRPDLTAERFMPDPFGAELGGRLYRTGDRARWRANGHLEFLGRVDHQVKIRGFRIELGEIEAWLREHPQVQDSVVIVREDHPGDRRLVAYFVHSRNQKEGDVLPGDEALRAYLKEHLPDYMMPAAFVSLDTLPLTANGKTDRRKLPAPDWSGQFARHYRAPGNAVEAMLAAIWAEVLRVERVGVHDNFFSLGGESILAIQVAIRAHKAGLAITPRQLFQHQTVAELALVARTIQPEEFADGSEQALPAPSAGGMDARFVLSRLEPDELADLPYDLEDIEDIYPLTPMQEGMLFHTLMAPHTGVYLMQDRFELEGWVNVDAFHEAWNHIVQRHPVLRTGFVWETKTVPHQIVHKKLDAPFEYFDWRDQPKPVQERRLDALLRAELTEGFDLMRPPLLRLRLFRVSEKHYRFVRSHHHILLDAWCTSLILTEFKSSYDALAADNAPDRTAAAPFSNYIAWLQKQDATAEESFWRHYLAKFAEPTPLVVDCPLAATEQTEVADIAVQLSTTATRKLNELARCSRLTPNTFVQGAWALLLSRYSGAGEVLFGITVTGRPADLANVDNILGLFINALPLRVSVDPKQPVQAFLQGLLRQNLDMRQYEQTALTRIQSWCELPRGQDIFQHLLTFENAPVDPKLRQRTGSFWFSDVTVRTHTNYPITIMAIPDDRLHLQISYQTARFKAATIERMLRHFNNLLEDMIEHPDKLTGELAMLAEAEHRQILLDWNQTEHRYSEPRDMAALFETQAALTPDAIAAAFQGQALTYFELNKRVNRVAHALLSEGVGPETLIAVFNDRGNDYLVMMLSVFKAGSAYLPLDPSHPDGRIAQVLKESGVELILTGASCFERASALADRAGESMEAGDRGVPDAVTTAPMLTLRAPALLNLQLLSRPEVLILDELESCGNETENPPKRHISDNLAFVIFTSGSTGMPKGAMVEYQGMFNNLITKVPALGLTERDAIAQTAGQCFDISVWQHLTALVCGARVEIFPDEIVKEPNRLLSQLAERGITILEAVPSMIQALLEIADEAVELPKLRWLIACGEVFPPELCRRWMQRFAHVKVLNAYGPAECSDDVSYYEVPARPGEADTIVPIGRPVHNTRLYLLDCWMEPVPIGVPGEICVAGIQVGRGYLNRPDLTAEKFIPDPFDEAGTRLYRTGDLGRYREDGTIEFLGRIDNQVKIRGVRIEPGEIEAQLLSFPQVEQALVTVREDGVSGKRLVAYVVCSEVESNGDPELLAADIGSLAVGKLRDHLSARLPSAMMPSAFVQLDAMPLSANGKIDRKALPEPDMTGQSRRAYVAPRNPTETMLADIWKEVLGIGRVGMADNFFELGGHSLLAVQVLSRIRRVFGVEMSLRRLFDASTIEALALRVEELLIEQLDSLSEEEAEALLTDDEGALR